MFLRDWIQLVYTKAYHAFFILFASVFLTPDPLTSIFSWIFKDFFNPSGDFCTTLMLFTFHYHFLLVSFFAFDFYFPFQFHSYHTGLLTLSLQCFSLYLLVLSPLLFVSGLLSFHCPCTPLYLSIVLYLLSSYFIYYSLFPCSLCNHCALEFWPWSRLHCTRSYGNRKQTMCLWPCSQIQEKKLEESIAGSKENLLLLPLHIDHSIFFIRGRIRTVLLKKNSQEWKHMSILVGGKVREQRRKAEKCAPEMFMVDDF